MQANDLRQHLTIDPSIIHLNNAGVGPMTRPAQEAIAGMAALQGDQAFAAVPEMIATYEASREIFGRLVGVSGVNVSMMQTCAAALSQVALGLSYQVGDEIIFM